MKIWIHLDGNQEGPFELNELPIESMDAETPVWYDGLQGWMPAGQAPLTAHLFGAQPTGHDSQPIPEPTKASGYNGSASNSYSGSYGSSGDPGKPPRTYIVWSLLLTICCCNPIGIVPLVLGGAVNIRWRNRDYIGARKAHNALVWWFIITIVTGLMMQPFAMLMYL